MLRAIPGILKVMVERAEVLFKNGNGFISAEEIGESIQICCSEDPENFESVNV